MCYTASKEEMVHDLVDTFPRVGGTQDQGKFSSFVIPHSGDLRVRRWLKQYDTR
jgi:hypothetical protein